MVRWAEFKFGVEFDGDASEVTMEQEDQIESAKEAAADAFRRELPERFTLTVEEG